MQGSSYPAGCKGLDGAGPVTTPLIIVEHPAHCQGTFDTYITLMIVCRTSKYTKQRRTT